MARVSIYVPDELKAQMDEAGDEVNWSEVARPAFTAAIAAYRHRKEQNMDTAIERLRASKAKYVENEFEYGKNRGREAAQNELEFEQLVAVSRLNLDHIEAEQAFDTLKLALDPEEEWGPQEFFEFLAAGNPGGITGEFGRGFIAGAQELYDEVRDQL